MDRIRINDFATYVKENKGASNKEILSFLEDLKIGILETKEDM